VKPDQSVGHSKLLQLLELSLTTDKEMF